jgi:hypothetical protein
MNPRPHGGTPGRSTSATCTRGSGGRSTCSQPRTGAASRAAPTPIWLPSSTDYAPSTSSRRTPRAGPSRRAVATPSVQSRTWWSPLEWLAEHLEVRLRFEDLTKEDWLGCYDPNRHEIVIDVNLLPGEMFETLAHEIVHAIRRDHGDADSRCHDEDQVDVIAQAMFQIFRVRDQWVEVAS